MAFFDLDLLCKGCRHLVGILAWTWAIFVFLLSYFGRGHYNHINNNNEFGPPPFFHAVFVPVLKVLVVAPSGSFGLPLEAAPGSAGHHGNVQSGQRRFIDEAPLVYCAGCTGGDGEKNSPVSVYSGSPLLTLPTINNNNNLNNNYNYNPNPNSNNRGFAFANNPLIDRIDLNSQSENQNVRGNQDPASVQYINMNQDGQYNFAYSALDSSRQERRNQDGSVQGSYSYRNPAGRLVEIQYTAGNSGFNAYGENVPPRQIAYTPIPVQDTPAVKAAREQFLNTYAQELNRINSARAQEQQQQLQLQQQQSQGQILHQTVQHTDKSPSVLPLNTQNSQPLPISGIASDNNKQGQKPDTFDDEDDTEVVYAALANSYNNAQEQKENKNKATFYTENQNTEFKPENLLSQENKDKVQSSYGFWTKETITPGVQVPLANTKNQNQQNQLPAYFYYVSVGGAPHYVTSNTNSLVKNNFPTSLRASLLGAVPIAAVHDAQVRYSGDKVQQKSSPPLYLDLESNKQEENVQNKQILNPALLNTFSVVNLPNQAQGQGQTQVAPSQMNNQPSPGGFSQVQLIGYPVFVV